MKEELKNAAKEHSKTVFHKPFSENPQEEHIVYDPDKFNAFIAGAEWMKEQMMKEAEKDLALTPDDIKLITKIHYEIVFKDTSGIKVGDVASEVLRRYLEAKK